MYSREKVELFLLATEDGMGPTMTPNASTASRPLMPPSTTAEAAATFCSYMYLVCLPSMDSSTSLPNDRYT